MGTSTGYGMPTGGEWTPLKNEATKFVKDEGQGKITPGKLLSDYLKANGGATAISHGGGIAGAKGGGGGGGTGGGGARTVGHNLGGFLSSVESGGLGSALENAGLGNLIGKSLEEVSSGLLDALAEPSSTLDEHAARLALAAWRDELLKGAETYDDFERSLTTALSDQGLIGMLASFFGHYLYERFCRDFYETWVKKVGSTQAARSLKSVKDCIKNSLQAKLTGRKVGRINWQGSEGLKLTQLVMQETLEIFQVMA